MTLILNVTQYSVMMGGSTWLQKQMEKRGATASSLPLAYPLPGILSAAARIPIIPELQNSLSSVSSTSLKPNSFLPMRSLVTTGLRTALVTSVFASSNQLIRKDTDGLTRSGHLYISAFSGGIAGMTLSSQLYLSAILKRQNPTGYSALSPRTYTNLLKEVSIFRLWDGMKSSYPRAFGTAAVAGLMVEALKTHS